MQVILNLANVDYSETLEEQVHNELTGSLGHLADRLTRVEAHIADLNETKRGPDDKRCRLEARPAGLEPVVVECTACDFYEAVREATGKLQRALSRRYEKANFR